MNETTIPMNETTILAPPGPGKITVKKKLHRAHTYYIIGKMYKGKWRQLRTIDGVPLIYRNSERSKAMQAARALRKAEK